MESLYFRASQRARSVKRHRAKSMSIARVFDLKPAARGWARVHLCRKNWRPRLYICLKHVGCGKGASILAAVLFG